MHLQDAWPKRAKRAPTERDYTAWLGGRAMTDGVMRSGKLTPTEVKAYLLSDQFRLEGFKGQAMGPPAAATDHPGRRHACACLGLASGRLPAPHQRHRHAWLRPAGDQVQA